MSTTVLVLRRSLPTAAESSLEPVRILQAIRGVLKNRVEITDEM
jgi:hypothetical protein